MKSMYLAAAAAIFVAVPAAAETVDGVRDASYGTAQSSVIYNPVLASYAFSAANGNYGEATGYDIYLTSDASAVYGFLQTTTPGGIGAGSFANLYFDIDPANGNGSDLGFEITNGRAFVPGMTGYSAGTAASPLAGLAFALSSDGSGIEFSIANSLFTGPIAGLTYYGGQQFPGTGDAVTLRIAQAFNYAVAGGSVYGANRLGTVAIGGNATSPVPEPATWAMMIAGFGLVGGAMRRRKTSVAFA